MSANDDVRGHAFLPDADVLDAIPRLYTTEDVPADKRVIYLHFFVGACDWHVAELGEDRRTAFGFVNLGDAQNAEWGYMDLHELAGIVITPFDSGWQVVVERDLHWEPRSFSEVIHSK